jgi:hypothetical protein
LIRAWQLWLLRWQEEAALAQLDHHQALRDLHASAYDKASADLRRVRIQITLRTPAHQLVAEALSGSRVSS